MNWKAEAIEKLRQYSAMCQAAVNLPQTIKQLETDAHTLQSVKMDSPVGKGSTKREDAIINNILERQALTLALEQTQHWLRTTNRALSVLSEEDRLILHRLYIKPEKGSLEQLCKALDVESSTVYRRRDKALKTFTIALYGICQ